jgi:nicotinamide-nucleotide amidase
VREATGSDIGVSVTGIAGPDGGSAEKPVGTVWIGVASSAGVQAVRHQLGNERQVIRERSAYIALDMVRREALRLADSSPAEG